MRRSSPSDFDQIVASTHPREETLAELGRRIGDGFEAPSFLSEENAELTRLRAENETLKRRMLAHGISLEPTIEEVIAENYAAGMREYIDQSDDFVKGDGTDNRTHELRPDSAEEPSPLVKENEELRAKVASLQKTIADHIGIKPDGVQVEVWSK